MTSGKFTRWARVWVLSALALLLVGGLVAATLPSHAASENSPAAATGVNHANMLSEAFRKTARDVLPAVVAAREVVGVLGDREVEAQAAILAART